MIASIVIYWAMKSYSVVPKFPDEYTASIFRTIIFGIGNLIAKYFIFWNFALCEFALYKEMSALLYLQTASAVCWKTAARLIDTDVTVEYHTLTPKPNTRYKW